MIRDFWEGTLRSCPNFSLQIGESSGGRVLVSPIGRRPGVLFSALQSCQADGGAPTLCLVICSRETEGSIEEAARRAEYTGAIEQLRLDDPHGGRTEIERLAKKARRRLIGADRVLVNVTGGTTLMGFAAEELANAARRLACPVRRFGLIDRRPPQQQDAEPYRTGELFWLDSRRTAMITEIDAVYRIVTPLFCAGADPKGSPELRLAGFKGVLRYWWRALAWAECGAQLDVIQQREDRLFGSAGGGNPAFPCAWSKIPIRR